MAKIGNRAEKCDAQNATTRSESTAKLSISSQVSRFKTEVFLTNNFIYEHLTLNCLKF